MKFRVRYQHQESGEVARYNPMGREHAVEIARQLVIDGGKEVRIEDDTGQLWSIEGLAGS